MGAARERRPGAQRPCRAAPITALLVARPERNARGGAGRLGAAKLSSRRLGQAWGWPGSGPGPRDARSRALCQTAGTAVRAPFARVRRSGEAAARAGTNPPSAACTPSPLSMRSPPPALGYVRSSGRASESSLEHKRPRGPRRLEAAGAAAAVGSGAPATAFSRRRRRPSSAWHSARPGRFVASRPSSPSHGLRFATPA